MSKPIHYHFELNAARLVENTRKKVYYSYDKLVDDLVNCRKLCITSDGNIEVYEGALPDFATAITLPSLNSPTNHIQYPHTTWKEFGDTFAMLNFGQSEADPQLIAELMITMTFIPSIEQIRVFGRPYGEMYQLELEYPEIKRGGYIPKPQWATLWQS